jgi:MFS transporter, MHS family, proline/betaine transporter
MNTSTISGTGASSSTSAEHLRKSKRATFVAVLGTFIEYYDFSIYGYVAATLAQVFFPKSNPTASLLDTLAVFGLAFLIRPIGAWFFGRLGDVRGRRTSLIASIVLMGLASTITGFLPGYALIGVMAPVLLVLMRLLQGFSTGGEIGGAASYIREWAPPHRRALYIAFIPSVAQLGKGLAAGIAALMAAMLTPADLLEWGWRVPYILALPLALLTIWLRLSVEDSPEFVVLASEQKPLKSPMQEIFSNYPKQLMKVITISMVQNIGTYLGTVFVAVYFSEVLQFTKSQATTIVLCAVLFASVLIPFAGLLGTKIGGKKTLLIAYALYAVVSVPEFMLMNQKSLTLALVGLLIGIIPYALCQAGTYSSMPELFPTRVRHSGVAFGHSLGAVIGGGGGPYFATWLIGATGDKLMPSYLLAGAGLIGLVVVGLTVKSNPNGSHTYR